MFEGVSAMVCVAGCCVTCGSCAMGASSGSPSLMLISRSPGVISENRLELVIRIAYLVTMVGLTLLEE